MKKGNLIVFDGTDGGGKATQTRLMIQKLQELGVATETIDFPRRNAFFGKLIYQGLEEGLLGDFLGLHPKVASVLYAADRYDAHFQINEWLESGKTVIADRYVSANQIHQGGKTTNDEERKEFLLWLDEMEHGIFKIPRPSIIFYLDVPYKVSVEMINKRNIQEQEKNLGRRVNDQHEKDPAHQIAARESALKMLTGDPSWVRIQCSDDEETMLPAEVIHQRIMEQYLSRITL